MTIHRFQLQGEFIELNVLLKLLGLAPSGGAAKALVAERAVAVDGEIETRTRRKLRPGHVVRLADEEVRIVAADDRSDIEPSAAAGPPQGGAAKGTEPRQRRTTVTPSREGEGGVSRSTAPRRRSRRAVQSPPWGGAGGKAIP